MKRSYEMQWPRENLHMTCYAHEIMNYRYHWHEREFELDILLHGSEEFCVGTRNFWMEEDDVVLISPGTGHASFAQEENTNAIVLRFSESAFKPFLKPGFNFSFPECISEPETRYNPFFNRIRFYTAQILQAASQEGPFSNLTAKASLQMLLSTLCCMGNPQTVPTIPEHDEQHQELLRSLIRYMEEHYSEKITLEDLAAYSQYNRTYLSTLFKNIVGVNFYEYLTRIRFQQALFDLASSQKNLTEIAIDNGFSDLKSFNSRFKETLQMTPAEYRSRIVSDQVANRSKGRSFVSLESPSVSKKLWEYMRLPDY